MLADRLPKTAAEEAANREARAAELTRRIARNEAAQKGLMIELAELGDASSPASTAYRQRIREHVNSCSTTPPPSRPNSTTSPARPASSPTPT